MKSLAEIYRKYEQKKGISDGTDKDHHGYIKVYEKLLAPYRGRYRAQVLEVGVMSGCSLLMWHEYFVDATVHGVDCCDARVAKAREVRGIVFHHVNIKRVVKKDLFEPEFFDVVIDDGSHEVSHQLLAATYFYQKLKPGGLLVIEDAGEDQSHKGSLLLYRSLRGKLKIFDTRKEHHANSTLITITKPER